MNFTIILEFRIAMINAILLYASAAFAQPDTNAKAETIMSSDSVALFVRIKGQGIPCLFLHGGPGQGCRSFYAMRGDVCEKYFKMIYLDQRGSGKSQTAKDYSLDRVVADIEDVRKALGLDKVILMSHSFGGILAVNYAIKYPQQVGAIILVNSTLHFSSTETLKEQVCFLKKLLHKACAFDTANRDTLAQLRRSLSQLLQQQEIRYSFIAERPETVQRQIEVDNYTRSTDFGAKVMQGFYQRSELLYPEYYRDHSNTCSLIKCPVLIVAGRKDYAIGTTAFRTMNFPDRKLCIIDGSHLLYYEKNKAFIRAVGSFYRERIKRKF